MTYLSWEILWPSFKDQLRNTVGDVLDPEATLFSLGVLFSIVVFYWGQFALLYLFCYKWDYFKESKIQGGKHPPSDLVRECVIDMAYRHLALPFVSYGLFLVAFKDRLQFEGTSFTWTEMAIDIIIYQLSFDAYFYWSHRLVHHPLLYSKVHKQHHKFTTPIGVCAGWASLSEEILVNLPSTLIGPAIFPRHFLSTFVYVCMRSQETVEAHSGYEFWFSPWVLMGRLHGGPLRHDWHHSHQVGCYGGFTFWDWICGTDKQFHKWVAKKEN